MLAIITTHPIQYQVPIWQALAAEGRVPFEVWYLTRFGTNPSPDPEFGKTFAWDIDLLSGYPYRFLETGHSARPDQFWNCRLREKLRKRMQSKGVKAVWIQGWQVAAYWQAVWAAKTFGAEVWLRAESNDLSQRQALKGAIRRQLLARFFANVDRFFFIGSANKRMYERFGVGATQLISTPYAVDNARFADQAAQLRKQRNEIRRSWNIPEGAFCILFCGKFIEKKRPLDLVSAAARLRHNIPGHEVHLLFVGSGALDQELRRACCVAFDAQAKVFADAGDTRPRASFCGFLNQTEISRAYVAADCLVLPSDAGETWGLVVNEALASNLPCIVSAACGCAEDLIDPDSIFRAGDIDALALILANFVQRRPALARTPPSITETISAATASYAGAT